MPRSRTDVGVGLLLGFGDVHRSDEAPLTRSACGAERCRPLLDHAPVVARARRTPRDQRRSDRQQADAVLPGQPRTGRRATPPPRAEFRGRSTAQAAVGSTSWWVAVFAGDGLARKQAHDDVEVVFEEFAGVGGIEPDHRRVGGQRARAHPPDDAAVSEVVEQHQPVGHP